MPPSPIRNSCITSAAVRSIAMLAAVAWVLTGGVAIAADGADPIFEKPAAVTMDQLAQQTTTGVCAVEVSDYAPGHYPGELVPSPPHADMNPKRAIVVCWKDQPQRLVFSHEASYCPVLELPDGAGMCNQFFEGNIQGTVASNVGSAEIFNIMGRKERNSFVDVIQAGPERVWVRWNYFRRQ